jgi:hypothetical protein
MLNWALGAAWRGMAWDDRFRTKVTMKRIDILLDINRTFSLLWMIAEYQIVPLKST